MSVSDDSFATVVESDESLCALCSEEIDPGNSDSVPCRDCHQNMHYHCRGISQKKGKAPTLAVQQLLLQPWVSIQCDRCLSNPQGDKIASMAVEISEIRKGVTSIVSSLSSDVGAGSKGSYAKVTGFGKPDSALSKAVATAVRQTTSEEERNRSIVVDNMKQEQGVSDLEQIELFLQHCGLATTVRIKECYRLGSGQSTSGRPPKLKLVLHSHHMQQQMLSQEVRTRSRSNTCPPAFKEAYFNPSRTSDQRRLLAKLRHRRNELNESISEREDTWFIDYKRGKLVKRNDGNPDWAGPGDIGWSEWESNWDKENPPRRASKSRPSSASASGPSSASNLTVKPRSTVNRLPSDKSKNPK